MVNYSKTYTKLHIASAFLANNFILINAITESSKEFVAICQS